MSLQIYHGQPLRGALLYIYIYIAIHDPMFSHITYGPEWGQYIYIYA